MKTISKILALGLGLAALVASATNITVDSTGALLNGSGVANDAQYGQPNNNPESNLAFLNTEIANWNTAFDPDLPVAVGPVASDSGDLDDISNYTALAGYQYVVFHFGNGSAGGTGKEKLTNGGWWMAVWLDGAGGDFEVPMVDGKSVGGFSSARYFNQVPDGGVTIVLLGLGLLAMALRFRRTKSA